MLLEIEYSIESSGRMNHASKVLRSINLLFKLMKHGCMKNIKESYSWQWHKMETTIFFPFPSLWLKRRMLVDGVSLSRISDYTLLCNLTYVWFQADIHPLKVHVITLITVGKILLVRMSTALNMSLKIHAGDQRQDTLGKIYERMVCINRTIASTLVRRDQINKCICVKVDR